jgi:uncharacterized membrane protein YbhN (UPF0104 family)
MQRAEPRQGKTGRPNGRRTWLSVAGAVVVAVLLAAALRGKRDEFVTALDSASLWLLGAAVLLQLVALLSRTEAWHVCIRAAGGTIDRRPLYRASSMGVVGALLNAQLGAAARIAALRRSAPDETPRIPALIGAELPIVAIEGALAALTSFTLIGPLGLPWWFPIVSFAVALGILAALRGAAGRGRRTFFKGLAVLGSARRGIRVVLLILVAVFAQIARNYLMLHAVGIPISLFDSIALLIAMVTLSQLPVGPSVGAASAVIVLGPQGVALVAAAGVLLTATGTAGALCFAAWAVADRVVAATPLRVIVAHRLRRTAAETWTAVATLPAAHRRSVEVAYFGGLTCRQIARTLQPSALPAAV